MIGLVELIATKRNPIKRYTELAINALNDNKELFSGDRVMERNTRDILVLQAGIGEHILEEIVILRKELIQLREELSELRNNKGDKDNEK